MSELHIRPYNQTDQERVIQLWLESGLVVPHNNPIQDIQRKLSIQPQWFLVGTISDTIVGSCMAGYEGHRGWINYLAVAQSERRQGYAAQLIAHSETLLKQAGCPKISLQIRRSNKDVINFYQKIGYAEDDVISMGKRITGEDTPFTGQKRS